MLSPAALSWGGLAAVCLLVLAQRLPDLQRLSHDYDEGVYWQSLQAVAAHHRLYAEVFMSQPPAFTWSMMPGYLVLGGGLMSARLLMLVSALVAVIAMYETGRRLAGNTCGLVAAALLAFDPHFAQVSTTLQAEAPALAMGMMAVALAARAGGGGSRLTAALSGLALGWGIGIKLFDVVMVVPVLLLLVRGPDRTARVGIMSGGILAAVILMLVPVWDRLGAVYDQSIAFHIKAAETSGTGLNRLDLILLNRPALVAMFLAVGAVIALGLNRDRRLAPALAWLVAAILLLVQQRPLLDHHLALIAPPLALLGGLATAALERRSPAMGRATVALAAGVAAAALSFAHPGPPSGDPGTTRQVALIRAHATHGDLLVTDEQFDAALGAAPVPPELADTSFVRIEAGYLTAATVEEIISRDTPRLVIFRSGRLARLPGLERWVRARYHLLRSADAVVYER